MIMPISEILDRYSIAILKRDRANANNYEELVLLKKEIEKFAVLNREIIDTYIEKFIDINSRIWDLESDIRRCKDELLGYEEIGRRAVKIRELNKIRVTFKNEIVDLFGEGFKDIKENHISQ